MIKSIAHLSDIHIHNLQRYSEYRIQFDKIYKILEERKPDRIVIVGDLFEKFVEISNEANILASEFLNRLSQISKVVIVPGNHDYMSKNKNRLNSVFTIINIMNNPNITYFGNSGFYEDDDVVWVNYSHLEKDIEPWVDIKHTKDESKIYIALYHDPINGAIIDTKTFEDLKYKSITDFKNNDIILLGDIHKFQYFRKKTAAYCSSTIQQNFGESPDEHGFIIWNIDNKKKFTSEFIDIPNDHNYINFDADTNMDYDNITFSHPLLNPLSEVKIRWTDISAKVNFENEVKIREYFKNTYGLLGIKITKVPMYTDVSNVEMVNESIDVLNPDTHRKIFIEYLEANGYDKVFVKEILALDDTISNRLQLDKDNGGGISWMIDEFWFDNFKSYGDGNRINWKNENGIYQIHGENQQGKTTILDAISYILYGTTSTTLKRQKNGDARYINKMRDLDYTEGGAIININDDIYTITRRTERKWNRSKTELVSCSTVVDYYKGTIIDEEFKLSGEVKSKTQAFIESAIGDFSDFVRLVLTTADNINDMLSQDRSVFIDSIIKDAGYDIFEKKLEEFKLYRKDIVKNDIKIDIEASKTEIDEKQIEKNEIVESHSLLVKEITELEASKPDLQKEKDKLLSSLDKIDERISNLDLTDVNNKIEVEKAKVITRKEQLGKIKELKVEVEEYDNDALKNKRIEYDGIKDLISEKTTISNGYINKITENKSKLNSVNMDINNIVDSHVRLLEGELKDNDIAFGKLKDNFNTKVIEYSSVLKQDLNTIIAQKDSYQKDMNNLMEEGKKLKKANEELETSKVCVTCGQSLKDVDPSVINGKIEENKNAMSDIMTKIKDLKPKYEELSLSIDNYKKKLDKLSLKQYDFDEELNAAYNNLVNSKNEFSDKNEEIERKVKLINSGNFPNDLQVELKTSWEERTTLNDKISELEDNNKELIKIIEGKKDEVETLKTQMEELEKEEAKIQKKREAINMEEKIKADIERANNSIDTFNKDIEKYNEELDKIESNKAINEKIESCTKKIDSLDTEIKTKTDEKSKKETSIAVIDSSCEKLMKDIKIFEKQKIRDEILDAYMKCVHRDGLPTFLLKKSIHIINQELNNILVDVDFNLYFDDELTLKLSHDIKIEASQNAIESSGMERTFCALALKMSLRKINNKSKPNFIMLDEIMLKLINASVEKFIKLLDTIKTQVDKLIIIEHVHPINYDVLIEVEKDEYGVSTLKIED